MPQNQITFLRSGKTVHHKVTKPTQTVLEYLRLERRDLGTKEGCNEGDCGACTVAIGRLRNGAVSYEAVNSCILLMPHVHGCELVTVDDITPADGLHPLQQAFVDNHASQCGFCTPGFVMSAFQLYHGAKADRSMVLEQFSGNLCRCTGYRPIIAAALQACNGKPSDAFSQRRKETEESLKKLETSEGVFCGTSDRFIAIPTSENELLALAHAHPDAILVGGGTDISIWITKRLIDLPKLIFTHQVKSLHSIADRTATLSLGGAVTYAEATRELAGLAPDLAAVVRRIGSRQIRAQGTIGGNIANGSPIGDMSPMLMALGSRIVLRRMAGSRDIPLENFFVSYGKQDRQPGEVLWRIDIPKLRKNERFFAHKLSKRFEQDISAVLSAFKFTIAGRTVSSAVIAFGGMAATPKRATRTEAALAGLKLDDQHTWDQKISALSEDFDPIGDMRASAQYRLSAAMALLRKALLELSGQQSQSLKLATASRATQPWL
jgi:xanthine dehydrogenase small subunit